MERHIATDVKGGFLASFAHKEAPPYVHLESSTQHLLCVPDVKSLLEAKAVDRYGSVQREG